MVSPSNADCLAILLLAAAGLLVAAATWRWTRPWRLGALQKPFYALNVFLTRVLWRASVRGALDLPPGRGAVIVCNHRSSVDPCFLQLTTFRLIHWLVAKEYYTHWASGWLVQLAETIPVNRGAVDAAATKAAIRAVEQGQLVGMFPEGRINTTGRVLLPGRLGAAHIALKARAPIVPCFIHGSPTGPNVAAPLLRSAQARVEIGRPLDLSEFYGREGERDVLEEVTRRVLQEIARLGGYADFQPEIVGRRATARA